MGVGVHIGNFLYFLFIALLGAGSYISYLVCQHFGKDFSEKFIITVCWLNFALHFLKQLNPYYLNEFPQILRESTLCNLCAVLIVFAPFILTWGNDYLKDYFVVMGMISGLAVFLYPSTALSLKMDNAESFLEVLRFYLCHAMLFIPAFLMAFLKLHHVSYRRIFMLPIIFLCIEALIFVNQILCFATGLEQLGSWEALLNRDVSNPAFVYGPPSSMDAIFSPIYNIIPSFFKYYAADGTLYFTPVLFMLTPMILIGYPLFQTAFLAIDHKEVKQDYWVISQKIKMRRLERAYLKK